MTTPTRTPRLRRSLVAVVVSALAAGLLAPGSAQAADPVPPTLVSLWTTPSAVTVPGTTSIQLRVAGPDRPAYAQVTVVEPSGRPRTVQLAMADDGPGHYTGTTSYAVKDGSENGHWKVRQVYLPTPYLSTIICDSRVQESYCTDHQDFSAVGLDVSGSVFDPEAPVVSAVAVTSPTVHVPDQTLDLTFDVSDVHPVTRLELQFRPDAPEAQGRYLTAVVEDAAQLAAGRASVAVPTAYDSTYRLRWLVTVDSVGNKATYRPDGWVNLEGGATGPRKHSLDFSALSFTASGSTMDIDPPRLESVVPSATKVVQGATAGVPVAYTATDAADALYAAYLCYTGPSAVEVCRAEDVTGTPRLYPLAGSAVIPTPSAGVYRLTRVSLSDRMSNPVEYRRDGSTYSSVTKASGTHTLSFAAADIRVVPAAPEVRMRPRPQSAEVVWAASEGTTGVRVDVTSGSTNVTTVRGTGPSGRLVVPGLRNGTTYRVSVTPESSAGDGKAVALTVAPALSGNVFSAGDVDNDRRPDLVAHLPDGLVRVYRGSGPATFGAGKAVVDVGDQRLFPNGRLDGRATFLSLSSGTDLQAMHLAWNVTYVGVTPIGPGWGMRFIDGSSDFTGDGKADIVAVTPGGTAYLYRGDGSGGYSHGTRIATGWSTMQTVFASPDVTGDRRADLLGVDQAGVLWIFPGTAKGTFTPKRKVGSGWGGLGALFHAGDVTGDGRGDLGAVTMDGTLRVYKGWGNGQFSSAVTVSKGWAPYL
ncbi:FG-GAP-like repeat-containing protein [Phycicoccus sp. Soil748]|uniref:FG-GAP-like repeat-containing protein n=1 Tax=Phycicoccus sp. Soil748 TaxID=1736397 RepID=UPI0007032461|nr:FG-GAP-like repeat-containing protein [Phycicoccus sp. Soil748]KRE56402.1 hypothetical protein ASG70_04570 [Phycicoccus sp. Soil748]